MSQPPYDPRRPAEPGYPPPSYSQRQAYGRPPQGPPPQQRPPRSYEPPEPPEPEGRGFRLPGLGLLLTLASVVVQVVSLFLLPWLTTGRNGQFSVSASELWSTAVDFGTHGFGGWYLVVFSYPLAALSILLALAAVFESVALKAIWVGLTLLGLGAVLVKFGGVPILEKIGGNAESIDFTAVEATIAVIALVALVVVLFLLKAAVGMFRRVAVLILLVFAGVHIAAVTDLVSSSSELNFGAFGPALGYLLCAAAALIPRRLPGM